jgi:lipopolysaccharide/colanic/teichoic acid biosynthesis glycosyltransferase
MRLHSIFHPSKIYNLQKPSKHVIHLQARFGDFIKRAFDISASVIALLFLWPFYLLVALAIRRDSPGPIFYRGERTGRGGKPFKILKFRTMYEAPESYAGPKVTAHDDKRITPLGRWLRDTKLNELPQIWNILKGEMSWVGPRPEDPSIAKTWPTEVWRDVLSVRPGITSPASVQYHDEESLLSAGNVMAKYLQELGPDKMRLDQLYVRHRSFLLDLDVIFWTAMIMVPRLGAHTIPESLLFVGPFTHLIRRYLRWFSIDLIVTFLAIGFTGAVFRLYAPLDVGWFRSILLGLSFAFLFSLTSAMFGVTRIAWSQANYADALDLLLPWSIATVIAFLGNLVLGIFPNELIIAASVLALSGFVVTRYRGRLLTGAIGQMVRHLGKADVTRERVLIVGTGTTAQLAAWLFDHSMNAGKFWTVGFVDNDLFKQGMRIYGARVIGSTKTIPDLVKKYDVGVIVLTDQTIPSEDYCSIIQIRDTTPTKLAILPDIMDSLLGFAGPKDIAPENGSGGQSKMFVPCRYCLARRAILKMDKAKEERQVPIG